MHKKNMKPAAKILVCITPQSNSRRLINKGHEAAVKFGGELHILHVEKGGNVFATQQGPLLLQELFSYASGLGGIIHGFCGDDIPSTIARFIKTEGVTHAVFGETPESEMPSPKVLSVLEKALKNVEIIIVKRNESK